MKFLEIILNNSTVKEAKLYTAAKKASIKPDTGVTIQNQSAYHVIKDCAKITQLYLPLYIFGQYQNPFQALKGKFSKSEIQEFLSSANSDFVNHQLLCLILEKIKKELDVEEPKQSTNIQDINSDDPYGDYGYSSPEPTITTTINSDSSILDLLCQAFDVSK
jgi:hypothetical protein